MRWPVGVEIERQDLRMLQRTPEEPRDGAGRDRADGWIPGEKKKKKTPKGLLEWGGTGEAPLTGLVERYVHYRTSAKL